MVSLSKIASLPHEFLSTTGALKNNFALSIDLTSQWFEYFGHVPSEGFTNVAKEARTVMGFISGLEFFRDFGSNAMIKQGYGLDFLATAASLGKKFCKFQNYLHMRQIFLFPNIKTVNIQESAGL